MPPPSTAIDEEKMLVEKLRAFWGWFFVVIGSFCFVGFVISNHFLPSPNVMQNDWYYCLLVPLTLPIVVVAVYFHWVSMKLFKHS